MSAAWLGILLSTFVFEDVALITALALVARGDVSLLAAFAACFAGIVIGDLALYALGFGFKRFAPLRKWRFLHRQLAWAKSDGGASFTVLIFLSRAIPGTRLPTYLASGFAGYSLARFTLITLLSAALWVSVVLFGGASLINLISGNRGLALLVAIGAFLFVRMLVRSVLPKLFDKWDRKAWLASWRRWLSFEFWPAWLFYLPIVPWYTYLGVRHRNFLLPFFANPEILNGGLIGESKWDFLKHLSQKDDSTLPAILIGRDWAVAQAADAIAKAKQTLQLKLPLVMKPDVGQRGYGVRVIRSEKDLNDNLVSRAGTAFIVQGLSRYSREAGVFYYRYPSRREAVIFSITDKEFPFVIADGVASFGDLILRDERARLMAAVYFARHRPKLDVVYPLGEKILLAECGNHCQGAIFKNGEFFKSEALLERIDAIACHIPSFYFGRFDIRYESVELLRQGLAFEIVEVNGAASEATHIWDADMSLLNAYKVLFKQWQVLFEIGEEARARHSALANVHLFALLKECVRVARRADSLSVSS